MAKIITAIAEENILKKIIKNKIIEEKNILYREAILDILKKNKNIDVIIISEKIPGDIDFIRLIKQIKKINIRIKIIIILYDKKMEKELIKLKIEKIYYYNIFNINKLIKEIKQEKVQNIKEEKNIKDKLIKIIRNRIKKENIKENKNNVICIYGKNKIDRKIIELIIIKKLTNKNQKFIKRDLQMNNKNIKREIKKTKNKYSKYKYLIFNISYKNKQIEKINIENEYINIIAIENNKKNLLELSKNINKKINLFIINYEKNNISKYFYKIILKNKFNKIKIIN